MGRRHRAPQLHPPHGPDSATSRNYSRALVTEEVVLPGGNAGGAVLVDGTVRRKAGPWTPTIHALLRFLEAAEFDGVPKALGIDAQGREILTYLEGDTIGNTRPWPAWVHSDEALVEVGSWLRRYHDVVVDFELPDDARWRMGSMSQSSPGGVIGHNDAAPYNAVWRSVPDADRAVGPGHSRLVGFVDWDFAAPCPAIWDLAFVAFSWIPLHARDVATSEGFEDFDDRPRRLRLLLDAYRYDGSIGELFDVLLARLQDHIRGIEALAATGEPLFEQLIDDGVVNSLERAIKELIDDLPTFWDDTIG
jgi:hypothetical protein